MANAKTKICYEKNTTGSSSSLTEVFCHGFSDFGLITSVCLLQVRHSSDLTFASNHHLHILFFANSHFHFLLQRRKSTPRLDIGHNSHGEASQPFDNSACGFDIPAFVFHNLYPRRNRARGHLAGFSLVVWPFPQDHSVHFSSSSLDFSKNSYLSWLLSCFRITFRYRKYFVRTMTPKFKRSTKLKDENRVHEYLTDADWKKIEIVTISSVDLSCRTTPCRALFCWKRPYSPREESKGF